MMSDTLSVGQLYEIECPRQGWICLTSSIEESTRDVNNVSLLSCEFVCWEFHVPGSL